MVIVKPSVTLLSITPNAEELIERAGRTAYKSEDKIGPGTAAKFIAMILKRGHESVLEHAGASLLFICDRGVTHEIVRHRLASYTQESTRYCNYGKAGEIAVVQPPGLEGETLDAWRYSCKVAEDTYLAMIASKVPTQIARSVLPTCLKTEIVMSANFREFRHFVSLRCAPTAHPQMQEVAKEALELLWLRCPAVFGEQRAQFHAEAKP